MADLNLRGVEAELVAELKSRAALAQMTLKEFCVMVLRSANFREVSSGQKNSIAPPRISMGADLAVGSDYGVAVVLKDGEVVSETFTGLSGTPINMEPFKPKPSVVYSGDEIAAEVEVSRKRRLVLDAVATTVGKVTVASEIPVPARPAML